MKIRQGFVSNSSSSSFIAVGIEDKDLLNKLVEAILGFDLETTDDGEKYDCLENLWTDQGMVDKDGFTIYFSDVRPFFVGLEAETLLIKDLRVSEIKQMFIDLVKERYGITVKNAKLKCGETYSG